MDWNGSTSIETAVREVCGFCLRSLCSNKRLLLSRFEIVIRSGRLAAPTRRDQVAAQQNREAVRQIEEEVSGDRKG